MCDSKQGKVRQRYVDSLDSVSRARYLDKISLVDNKDPYELPKNDWKSDVNEWPNVTYPDIVNYLVSGVSAYSLEDMKAFKSLDAYNQFVCGWVKEIHNINVGDKCLMSARVRHSQRMNDTPLSPWLIAGKEGSVLTAHCNCMAGLSEVCSHVGALLFAIDAAVKVRNATTVTQEKSYWMPCSIQNVPYSRISQMDFTSAKTKKKKLDNHIENGIRETQSAKKMKAFNAKNGDIPPPTADECKKLFDVISKSNSKPVLLATKPGYSSAYVPVVLEKKFPKILSEMKDENFIMASREQLEEIANERYGTVQFSDMEAKNVEELTKDQAKCKHWFHFRAGRITASKIKAACHTNPKKPSASLVKSICYPANSSFKTKATEWGCHHEKTAREEYVKKMSVCHENFQLVETGLNLNTKYPFLGATPDGLVSCDCCGEGCVEIKCPYCRRNDLITSKEKHSCLQEKDNGLLRLKESHEYFYQVQCQLLVCEKEYSDFVMWTNIDFHCERITADETFQDEMVVKSRRLFIKAILPELIGKLFSRSIISDIRKKDDTNPGEKSVLKPAEKPVLKELSASNIPAEKSVLKELSASNKPAEKSVLKELSASNKPAEKSVLKESSASNVVEENARDINQNAQLVICTCQSVYNEETDNVIGCDNENCRYQWMHYECANIRRAPKGVWYCPECRQLPEFRKK